MGIWKEWFVILTLVVQRRMIEDSREWKVASPRSRCCCDDICPSLQVRAGRGDKHLFGCCFVNKLESD